ncbi:hypothetical protein QBK99_11230 [Corticibacterium sp. UT-5YL-CI-8]|nr:hypothetical protein [Tianweitania sp. UT-5YL-CI-8]
MSKINDGGQAFPTHPILYSSADAYQAQGMSLRDRIAIEALGGMLAHSTRYRPRNPLDNWHKAISDEAYEIADHMLRARDGGSDAQR